MTKSELDKSVLTILKSGVPRRRRNNMILLKTEHLVKILGKSARELQAKYGTWDTYSIEVVVGTKSGYLLRFPDNKELMLKWGDRAKNANEGR